MILTALYKCSWLQGRSGSGMFLPHWRATFPSLCCVFFFSPQGCDKENRPVGVRGLWVHQPPAALLRGNSMREEHDGTVLSARPRLWASYRGGFYFWLCDWERKKLPTTLSRLQLISQTRLLISRSLSDSSPEALEAKTPQTETQKQTWRSFSCNRTWVPWNHPDRLPPSHHPSGFVVFVPALIVTQNPLLQLMVLFENLI